LSPTGDERLLSLAEGTHGITAVVERSGSRRLKLNNHYALGGTASTGDERMQAHVPLLLHPSPRRVAFLGVGTGITAGGALFHPVEQVTAIELVPEVIAAASSYFSEANAGVLDDARTRVIVDDARHALRGGRANYDVIVGDLVVPWRLGEGALFTLEQFEAARAALAPGGLFCQWVPLFQLSETETAILLRTFLAVFPRAQIWRGDFSPTEPAIALIGTADDYVLKAEVVERRLAEMRSDASNTTLAAPAAFWMNWVGVIEAGNLPPGETRINREDRPWIELLGPLAHGGGQSETFTGRKLQLWLDTVNARSRAAIELRLPAREARANAAGAAFAELVLCLAERDERGVNAAQERMRELLPGETFEQVFR
jgi:spermidine synthase